MTTEAIKAMLERAEKFTPLNTFQVWQHFDDRGVRQEHNRLCLSHEHLRLKLSECQSQLEDAKRLLNVAAIHDHKLQEAQKEIDRLKAVAFNSHGPSRSGFNPNYEQ